MFQLENSKYFGEFLEYWANHRPDKMAVSDYKEELNYRQLFERVSKIAGLLKNRNIQHGDRILVALGNSVQHLCYHYGSIFSGAVPVPIADNLDKDRIDFYFSDTEAKLLITHQGLVNSNNELIAGLDDFEDSASFCTTRENDDLLSIMYTTGSTDLPKGVMLPQKNLIAALVHINKYVRYTGDERELVLLPISHSFGLGHVYCCHINGAYVHLETGMLKPKRVFKAMADKSINGMPGTPSICQLLTGRYREIFEDLKKQLKYMVINSAPLAPETTKEMLAIHPELRLMVYYGLTEASRSTFITLSDEAESKYGFVGKASDMVEIKIKDGEVLIKGPHLFSGYWKREEETEQAFEDGWFKTGDLGELDEAKYLRITGRIKEQINVAGLKVSPQEVEKVISLYPGVREVAVAGIKDPSNLKGEVVGALIIVDKSLSQIAEAELANTIREYCGRLLEPHMLPEIIKITNEIPRASSGKILRKQVEQCLS